MWSLHLDTISRWSVQQSAPHMAFNYHSHVLYVLLPGDDIIDQVPMPGSSMHPRSLVAGGETEQCVGEDKVMGSTKLEKQHAVAVALIPVPCLLMIPSQVWWSVPVLALKSPRTKSLSDCGTAAMRASSSSLNLSLMSSGLDIVGAYALSDQRHVFLVPEWELEGHQMIFDTFWKFR